MVLNVSAISLSMVPFLPYKMSKRRETSMGDSFVVDTVLVSGVRAEGMGKGNTICLVEGAPELLKMAYPSEWRVLASLEEGGINVAGVVAVLLKIA